MDFLNLIVMETIWGFKVLAKSNDMQHNAVVGNTMQVCIRVGKF